MESNKKTIAAIDSSHRRLLLSPPPILKSHKKAQNAKKPKACIFLRLNVLTTMVVVIHVLRGHHRKCWWRWTDGLHDLVVETEGWRRVSSAFTDITNTLHSLQDHLKWLVRFLCWKLKLLKRVDQRLFWPPEDTLVMVWVQQQRSQSQMG